MSAMPVDRVQLYIKIHAILGRHPRLRRAAHKSSLYRTLMPLLANFDGSFSDRRYMTTTILPALASWRCRRLLFVGCKAYTARYRRKLARASIEYWTTDIDPEAEAWGHRHRHVVCDITKVDQALPASSFDAVLLNGVFGHGVDDEAAMNRAVLAIGQILRSRGILLIGWNSNKPHPDPLGLTAVTRSFTHQSVFSLPPRKTFTDTDHVYDWLVKNGSSEGEA